MYNSNLTHSCNLERLEPEGFDKLPSSKADPPPIVCFLFFFKKIQYSSVHGLWLIVSRQKEQLRQRASGWVFPERNLFFHTRIYPFGNSMPIELSNDLKGPHRFTQTELPWKIIETTFRPYTCTLNLPKFARKFLLIVSIVQYIHKEIQTPF